MDFVRDRTQADVHVIITSVETGSGGREYVLAFTGEGRRAGSNQTLKAITGTGDPEDVRRKQVLTTLRIGLLQYVAADGAPPQLEVDVEAPPAASQVTPRPAAIPGTTGSSACADRHRPTPKNPARSSEVSGAFSADRITPDWKLTFGVELDHETRGVRPR